MKIKSSSYDDASQQQSHLCKVEIAQHIMMILDYLSQSLLENAMAFFGVAVATQFRNARTVARFISALIWLFVPFYRSFLLINDCTVIIRRISWNCANAIKVICERRLAFVVPPPTLFKAKVLVLSNYAPFHFIAFKMSTMVSNLQSAAFYDFSTFP